MPWAGIGGVEIATARLIAATKDRVNHVAFCLTGANAVIRQFQNCGARTVSYVAPEPSLRRFSRFYRDSHLLADQIAEVGADIVHFSDIKAAYHTSLAARLAHTRLVCHVRVSYREFDWRHRLCLAPVEKFIFVSKEAMDTFPKRLPASQAEVIYDFVEPPVRGDEATDDVRRELGIPHGTVVVGMVARVSPQKDYLTLGNAAAQVSQQYPDTCFLVVGDNSVVDLNRQHYGVVTKYLDDLGIRDKFIFTGHRDDVSRLLAAIDISVLSTHREGFPLSILESMGHEKPVIATAVGGIPEIVESGTNGYLFEHGDSAALATAISSLIESPGRRATFGLAARNIVTSRYSKAQFAHKIVSTYYDLIGTPSHADTRK